MDVLGVAVVAVLLGIAIFVSVAFVLGLYKIMMFILTRIIWLVFRLFPVVAIVIPGLALWQSNRLAGNVVTGVGLVAAAAWLRHLTNITYKYTKHCPCKLHAIDRFVVDWTNKFT